MEDYIYAAMLKCTYTPHNTHINTQANMYTEVEMVRMEFH